MAKVAIEAWLNNIPNKLKLIALIIDGYSCMSGRSKQAINPANNSNAMLS